MTFLHGNGKQPTANFAHKFTDPKQQTPDQAFLALIDRVSPASRAVLLLRYQHDLTLEEAATILDIPINTAKSRLHYGVTTLRKLLTPERKPA